MAKALLRQAISAGRFKPSEAISKIGVISYPAYTVGVVRREHIFLKGNTHNRKAKGGWLTGTGGSLGGASR